MLLNQFTFHAPDSLSEAVKLYASFSDARLLAGGTFLLNSLKLLKRKGIKTPQNIISLKKIAELKKISADNQELRIGSMVVINELFASSHLTDNFAILKTVCRNISTNPIRNMATVGGNLTSRYTWTELGAPLIALEAQMHFVGPNQETENITVEDFFKNAAKTNKILSHLTIKRNPSVRLGYYRVKKLSDVDIPLLAVCARTTFQNDKLTDSRVSVNNTVGFARRDFILEKYLDSASISSDLPEQALNHLDTGIYDERGDDYKKAMFRVAIKRALEDLIRQGRGA